MGHLKDENVGYFRHCLFAFQLGLVMVLVGLCVIVHAFCPWWFKDTGSTAIKAMAKVLDE